MQNYNTSTIEVSIDDFPENVVIYRYENGDFIFTDINKNAQKSEDISKDALIGKKLLDVFPGAKEFGLYELLLKVYKNSTAEELDIKFYQDDRISGWRSNSIRKLSNGDVIVFYKDLSEYKILEEESKRRTKQLNETEKITHIGNWFWNIKTNEIKWSDEVYRIFGEEPQSFEASYEHFLSYIDKNEQQELIDAVNHSINTKEAYRFEHKVIRKDGGLCYVQESGKAQFNDDGEAISMIGNILDITQKKQHELDETKRYCKAKKYQDALLKWANVDYKNLQEAIEQATKISAQTLNIERSSVWLYKDGENTLECIGLYSQKDETNAKGLLIKNDNFSTYFKALKNQRTLIIEDARTNPITIEFLEQYLQPLDIYSILDVPIISQGQVIGVVCNEATKKIKRWSHHAVEFSQAIANNISLAIEIQKRKEAEQKVNRLSNLIDTSDTIVFYWKAEEHWPVEYVSSNIVQFGYTADDFLSAKINYVDIIFYDDRQRIVEEVISYTKANIDRYTQVYRIVRADGVIRWIDDRTVIERDGDGSAINYLGTIIDITEHKKVEDQLKSLGHIIDNGMNEVYIFDAETLHFTYINQEAQKHIGYSLQEMKEMTPLDIKLDYDKEAFTLLLNPLLKGERSSIVFETIHKCKNNDTYYVEIHLECMIIDSKNQFVVTANDITQRRESLLKLQESEEKIKLLGQAIEQMDEMVRITDKNGSISYVNDAFIAHTGYKAVELIGQNISICKSGKHNESFYKEMWDTILSGRTYRSVFINRKKDKQIYYEEETITPIFDSSRNIQHFVATSQDITQRIEMEKQLQKLATIDSLTKIYNRHKTNEEIDIEISTAKRYDETFTLVMFDIDKFKLVNDTFGHDVGDYVLIELSGLILNHIRDSDRFGRWGGEEFMLLLPKTNKEEAMLVASKLRDIVQRYPFKDVPKITISIGVSTYNAKATKEMLLKCVDDALYEAKESGRNRVVFKDL